MSFGHASTHWVTEGNNEGPSQTLLSPSFCHRFRLRLLALRMTCKLGWQTGENLEGSQRRFGFFLFRLLHCPANTFSISSRHCSECDWYHPITASLRLKESCNRCQRWPSLSRHRQFWQPRASRCRRVCDHRWTVRLYQYRHQAPVEALAPYRLEFLATEGLDSQKEDEQDQGGKGAREILRGFENEQDQDHLFLLLFPLCVPPKTASPWSQASHEQRTTAS